MPYNYYCHKSSSLRYKSLPFIPIKQIRVHFVTKTNVRGLSSLSITICHCVKGDNSDSINSSSFKGRSKIVEYQYHPLCHRLFQSQLIEIVGLIYRMHCCVKFFMVIKVNILLKKFTVIYSDGDTSHNSREDYGKFIVRYGISKSRPSSHISVWTLSSEINLAY